MGRMNALAVLAVVAALTALLVASLEHRSDRRKLRELERRMAMVERQLQGSPPIPDARAEVDASAGGLPLTCERSV